MTLPSGCRATAVERMRSEEKSKRLCKVTNTKLDKGQLRSAHYHV